MLVVWLIQEGAVDNKNIESLTKWSNQCLVHFFSNYGPFNVKSSNCVAALRREYTRPFCLQWFEPFHVYPSSSLHPSHLLTSTSFSWLWCFRVPIVCSACLACGVSARLFVSALTAQNGGQNVGPGRKRWSSPKRRKRKAPRSNNEVSKQHALRN